MTRQRQFWINIAGSHNKEGKERGISYCDLVWYDKEDPDVAVKDNPGDMLPITKSAAAVLRQAIQVAGEVAPPTPDKEVAVEVEDDPQDV